jgi:hypothetical protein
MSQPEKRPGDLAIVIPILNPTILDRLKRAWRWARERLTNLRR